MKPPVWRTRANRLKSAELRERPALAMWVTMPWPPLLEILGACGLDTAFIDLEHASFGLDVAQNMIVAAEHAGVTPLVRPSSIDPAEISKILDAGAHGIIFPLVNDAADAELARRSLRYPPDGIRAWGGSHTRHAMWQGTSAVTALRATTEEEKGVYSSGYVEKAAADVVSLFLVETVRGVENIDAILDAGKPDLVCFGWGDFSVEVRFDLAACEAAATRVYEACRRRGIGVSISVGQSGPTQFYPGCYLVVGIDSLILSTALRESLASAVERMGGPKDR